jgi:regulator of protease activity HflC (stomatin/prohibitin superfamily)
MPTELPTLAIGIAVAVIVILWSSVRVLKEYERGVVFRLGRLIGAKGPGLFFLIPIVDKMVRADLRVITMSVERQELMTRDNVPATVDAVLYFRVVNPNDAVTKVENFVQATSMISQTTLRSVIGQSELDELLAHRDIINQKLQQIIDQQTEPWGIKVSAVEVRGGARPDSMKRAMARQAEVERERRAKVINAEGEFQASQRLAEAAVIMSRDPAAIQLRFLQTLSEISASGNSNTIVPIPIDLFTPFLKKAMLEKTG